MKGEVRRQPLGLRRIHQAGLVTDDEHGGRRLVVLILDVKGDFARGQAIKQQVRLVAVADVLRALADVEGDLALALAGVAAVELDDPVFQGQTAQRGSQRLRIEHLQVEPQFSRTVGRPIASFAVLIVGTVLLPGRIVHRLRGAADRPQFRGHAGFVVNLDQELPPAFLRQHRPGGPLGDFHTRLRVDVHADQTVLVQHALDGFAGFVGVGYFERCLQRSFIRGVEWRTQVIGRFDHAPDLRDQWLQFDVFDGG